MNRIRWYLKRIRALALDVLRAFRDRDAREAVLIVRRTLGDRRRRAVRRRYDRWIAERLRDRGRQTEAVAEHIRFSVVVPIFRPAKMHLEECIWSVRRQSYGNWELILVDDGSADPELTTILEESAREDGRIRVITLATNAGIGLATNTGIKAAQGDYVCFLDHDDVLTEDALLLAASELIRDPSIDFLYGDEDKISPRGHLVEPWFRPDANLDLLYAYNFVSHPLAVRSSLLEEVGGMRTDLDGSQDHDLALRLADEGARFAHLPEIVYHWRISGESTSGSVIAKPYAKDAGLRAVAESVGRQGWNASVRHGRAPNHYEVTFDVPEPVSLAVIVCSARPPDRVLDALRYVVEPGLESLAVNVIIVQPSALTRPRLQLPDWPERWKHVDGRIYDFRGWPSVAAALNYGASKADDADLLLFVEDDVEVFSASTVRQAVGSIKRAGLGAVGILEIGPDRAVRQSGVLIGRAGPVYGFHGHDADRFTEHDLARCTREVTAVSASFMVTPADVFADLGGFSDRFPDIYFDFDYCARAREELGLRVVVDTVFPILKHGYGRLVEYADRVSDHERVALLTLLSDLGLRHDRFHAHNDLELAEFSAQAGAGRRSPTSSL